MKQNDEIMERGFTIIEVFAAIFLITVGVLGVFTLITQVISYISVSSSRLVASYLSQEGIEIVRNIRDTNWLEEEDWDNKLPGGGGEEWEADHNTQNLTQPYTGKYLNIDDNGFYSYSSGTPTKFKRKIRIFGKENLDGDPEGIPDIMKVSVEVSWQERGKTHEVTAQENLYNWY